MTDIFLHLFNMSITASWLALAVILLRLCLKKAPKAITVVLWALVGVRLLCPFSVESVFSLIPSNETVPTDILYTPTPMIQSGIPAVNTIVNPILSETMTPSATDSVNPMQVVTSIACTVWLIGIAAMLGYTAFSYLRLHVKVREAVPLEQNVYLCDRVTTPFILGIIKPRIYLPSEINQADIPYVLAHEHAHIRRRDHLWKPLGFFLLTVYWFNPVLWAAYVLLCKDIETACDEKVLATLGTEIKKPYADALINCSIKRQTVAACPLAFGEWSVAKRVKSVLHYKKPAIWLIALAIIASVVIAVCFLTDPITETEAGDGNVNGEQSNTIHTEYEQIKQTGSIYTIHRPPANVDAEIFGVNGWMLAQYLTEANWQTTDAPNAALGENGSVTFWLDGFTCSITVHAKKGGDAFAYAVVTQYASPSQDAQATYYRVPDGEYQKAVSLLRRGYNDAELIPYRDGTTFFYTNTVSERKSVRAQDLRYAAFEPKTFERLISELKKQVWIDDYLHERADFYLDGRVFYNGNWLYFGFEQKVVYYGRHYCTMSDKIMRMLREMHDAPADSDELVQRYPLLFGLDTTNGLTIYCGQMAPQSYSWSVLPNTSTMPSIFTASPLGAKHEDLLSILGCYGLTKHEVDVRYKSIMYSSYAVAIPVEYSMDDYNCFLKALFWGDVDEWGIRTEVGSVRNGTMNLLIEAMVTDRTISETLTTSPQYEIKSAADGKTVHASTMASKTLTRLQTQTFSIDLGGLPKGEYELCITVISTRQGRSEKRTYTVPFKIK